MPGLPIELFVRDGNLQLARGETAMHVTDAGGLSTWTVLVGPKYAVRIDGIYERFGTVPIVGDARWAAILPAGGGQ